jgi:hypothetical protein
MSSDASMPYKSNTWLQCGTLRSAERVTDIITTGGAVYVLEYVMLERAHVTLFCVGK